MVAFAQEEMGADGEAPDASTTLFQDCSVAVAQVAQAPHGLYAARMTHCVLGFHERSRSQRHDA